MPEIEIVQMYYLNRSKNFNTTGNFEREYRPKLYKRLRTFVWEDPIHESFKEFRQRANTFSSFFTIIQTETVIILFSPVFYFNKLFKVIF